MLRATWASIKCGGTDHHKERVDTYHFDSLSESASVKRRGRRELFEEKWRVGTPTRYVVKGVVGHTEAWRKRRTSKGPNLPGPVGGRAQACLGGA